MVLVWQVYRILTLCLSIFTIQLILFIQFSISALKMRLFLCILVNMTIAKMLMCQNDECVNELSHVSTTSMFCSTINIYHRMFSFFKN